MNRRRLSFLLPIIALSFLVVSVPEAQQPKVGVTIDRESSRPITAEEVERLRKQMDRLEEERSLKQMEEAPWEVGDRLMFVSRDTKTAQIELISETYRVGTVWLFESLDDTTAKPLRALMPKKGREVVALPAGRYILTMRVGHVDGEVVRLKTRTVDLKAGWGYRSVLDAEMEDQVHRRIKLRSEEPVEVGP